MTARLLPPAVSRPLITVQGLTVRYGTPRGPARAVSDANFAISERETVALIGESGSGKSTLAQAMLRLAPADAEVTGSVTWVNSASAAEIQLLSVSAEAVRRLRWKEFAYVSQASLSAFNPVMSVADHFKDTARAHSRPREGLESHSKFLLRQVNVDADRVWRAYPHELSGGTRQRAAIALAMLLEPRLLVLDEPTTALDVITQRAVLDILHDLKNRTGVSILFVTHDVGTAAMIADRILTMYAGRIVEDAPTERFLDRPLHPYSAGLLSAIPSLSGEAIVTAIPGNPPDLVTLPPGCAFHPRCAQVSDRSRSGSPPELVEVEAGRRVACHLHTPLGARVGGTASGRHG